MDDTSQLTDYTITQIAKESVPVIENNIQVQQMFIFRKKQAIRYMQSTEKNHKASVLKHFMVVNDQIKNYFKII